MRGDWPGILQPAALVDLVDQHLDHVAGRDPEERPAVLDLPQQFADFRVAPAELTTTPHARGPDQLDVAQLAVADPLDQSLAGHGVAAHEPRGDLQILFVRLLSRAKHALEASRIGRERFLHEDVYAFLHRILQVRRPAICIGGQHGHVPRPQAIDGVSIGVKSDELAIVRDVDLVAKPLLQGFQRVGHGGRRRSAMACNVTGPRSADRASPTAPLPRPPVPIRARRIVLSSPACTAGITLPANAAAAATLPVRLRNSRREEPPDLLLPKCCCCDMVGTFHACWLGTWDEFISSKLRIGM